MHIEHSIDENIKECIARKIRTGLFLRVKINDIKILYENIFDRDYNRVASFEEELYNNLKEAIETPLICSKYQKEWDLFLDSVIPYIRQSPNIYNLEFFYIYELDGEIKNYVVHDVINPNEDNTKIRRMFQIYTN